LQSSGDGSWIRLASEKEYTAFRRRELTGREYVYVWVDGVHSTSDSMTLKELKAEI
jgi:hypothetical protein